MDHERWRWIEQLYNAALAVPASGRADFLDRECASDTELRREIASLLAAHDQAGSFLTSPAIEDAALRIAARQSVKDQSQTALIGRSIHQYRIVSAIGKGGMGEVYLAEDTRLHRKVALKLLPAEFTGDADRVRRFEQEARVISALNHPNIVTLFDLGQCGSDYFMATEFVEGSTLREHLLEREKLPTGKALAAVAQIADALAAAHEAGIVHRDIKPENVILRRDGYVKVLDFGLAKIGGNFGGGTVAASSSITEAGTVMGTVSYMSPEQARGLRVDARTDVFSLGVVLYEMLASHTPFEGATASDVIASILCAEPNRMADAPEELNRIVMKSLAKDRDERYQTVADFARELNIFSREQEFQIRLADSKGRAQLQDGAEVVTAAFSSADHTEIAEIASPPHQPAVSKYLLGLAAAGLAIIVCWQLFFKPRGNFESEILPNLRDSLVESWKTEPEANQLLIDVSPNGNLIAFSKGQNGQTDIFVKQLNGGEPHRVTDDLWLDRSPVWSPDGLQLAYLSLRNGRWEVWLIPFLNGSGRMLKTLENVPLWLTRWSQDGTRIFYEAEDNFFSLNVHSGEITSLTHFQTGKKHFSVSKNETWLAYDETVGDVMHVWAMPLTGSAPVQVTKEGEENLYPVWLPDGERIVYSSKRNGVYQICVAWLDGRKPVQLTFGSENLTPWDISPDGRGIFYVSDREEADLFLCDVETGTPQSFSSSILLDLYPKFSPNRKTILFQQIDAGENLFAGTIFTNDLASGRSTQLVRNGFDPRWSPAADRVAFLRYSGKSFDLWTIRSDGAEERSLVKEHVTFGSFNKQSHAWMQPDNFTWSPDGSYIAYSSTQSGAVNIQTISVEGKDEKKISGNTDTSARLLSPIWSPDGKRIAWLRQYQAIGKGDYAIDLWDAGNTRTIFQSAFPLRLIGWSASGKQFFAGVAENNSLFIPTNLKLMRLLPDRGIAEEIAPLSSTYFHSLLLSLDGSEAIFIARQQDKDEVWRFSFASGQRRKLMANVDGNSYLSGLDWSPDKKLICLTKQSNFNSIRVIENFK
jgi:serine/threonine protein kinase